MSNKTYPDGCPKCKSKEVEHTDVYPYELGKVVIEYTCILCGYKWSEYYLFECWEPKFDE